MNNEYTMNISNISNLGSSVEKLGYTTTVKQQVENIQVTIDHFKKCIQSQKKQQTQLSIQLKKLEQNTTTNFQQMLNQIKLTTGQLNQSHRVQYQKQNKQFQYLELQNKILNQQHTKLNELSGALINRTNQMENSVGI